MFSKNRLVIVITHSGCGGQHSFVRETKVTERPLKLALCMNGVCIRNVWRNNNTKPFLQCFKKGYSNLSKIN